jgi:hypothetical protein
MRDATEVWKRIKAHQNEEFTTKTGLLFTYAVTGNLIVASRSPTYPFPVSQFEKGLERVPVDGPQQLHDLRAPRICGRYCTTPGLGAATGSLRRGPCPSLNP